jgi:transaldolase
MPSKLDQLRAMTVVVGDTGDIDAVRRLKPQDCTTNPSLVLKAVSTPAGKEILAEAVRWADSLNANLEARTIAACDRVAVAIGTELTRIVPGRVSTEVDADLSFNVKGSIEKAQSVIAAYAARGVPRERILIKLASTWEGIQAAHELSGKASTAISHCCSR